MDQELKQRLIGASVIIALAVIFVPMLFDGDVDQRNNQNISINIPDATDNNLEVKKFELDKPVSQSNQIPSNDVELVVNENQAQLIDQEEANQPITDPNPIPDSTVEIVEQTPVTNDSNDAIEVNSKANDDPVTEVAVVEESKPVSEEKTSESSEVVSNTATEASSDRAYRVKLGSFSQQGNAEKVKSSLLQQNIKAIVEYNPGLKLYRVWSQQLYRDESQANAYVKAVDQLKLNIGTPKVVNLNAEEVSQMAGQGQMGWVVQLGSFSAKDNAIELRNKVKAAGFTGFVDLITTSKGVKLYRLRIGPLMEKTDAIKTQNDIKQKLKLDGLVKAHEMGQIVN